MQQSPPKYDFSEIRQALSILEQPPKHAKRVILIRHGESEGNVRNVFYGSTDYALTDRGRLQARLLSEVFGPLLPRFRTIRSSNLTRSLQTCDGVVDLKHPLITSDFSVMEIGKSGRGWGIYREQELMETGHGFTLSNDFKRISPFKNPPNSQVAGMMANASIGPLERTGTEKTQK